MSSMRNAVQRRNHRERGQLEGREKWGILEKHKDYSLRAKDYNTKKEKIKRLQEKVRDRNPDEFAFGMMSSSSARQGKHGAAGNRDSAAARGLSHDAIKLLKTQDAGYLRTVGERIRRQMEKLEEEVRLQDGMKEILDGDAGEDKKKEEDVMDDDDMDFDFDFGDDEVDQKKNKKSRKLVMKKSRKQLEAERQALVEARRARKMKKRAAEARMNKLKALQKQYKEITAAERELDWQRGRMDNVVGGTNKNGVKWKIRERKK
ncbi:CFEM domain family protein [Aspergillus niger]|uniref:U3 small nucleolar RNA-associated protein 11 n=1 Tax=Aspergillus niger TaxID=5061 RepID=A0A505IG52_ASPNG|nr:CFEM domain family protein [Aspergillus niger]